ncbi:phosphoserine phosphatase SerB [Aeromicrobium sp. CTD01-1L150]|uniref:phosphoserine phosphatase SerB n=1 Tax=Aeromicrobium sp. CTD01-1L150 TaxID=3341830 RepID=UPI0035C0D58A
MTEHVPALQLTSPTVLVTLTGPDHSGVSTRLFEVLSSVDVEVVDVEQLVVRGRLVLSVLATEPEDLDPLATAVRQAAAELGLDVEIERGAGDNRPRRVGRSQVTVLGHPLRPAAMAALTARIKAADGNIDRILRLARYPVTALRLEVSGADPDVLQSDLAQAAFEHGIDVAVEERGILRHAQRLVVMDVDSTLIQGEVIEMLAEHAGCAQEVASVTEAAMRGELDFEQSLRQRVARLQGVPVAALDEVYENLVYTPGARTMIRTLKRLGFRFALVSGGFTHIIERIARDFGIDYHAANELEIVDGRLTGEVVGPVVDRAGKAEALRRFAAAARIGIKNTIAVGDGANDLDMLAAAGLGIAFNAKPAVRGQARTSVNSPYLDSIVYFLGITREEIEAADADD